LFELIRLILGLVATTLVGLGVLRVVLYKDRRPFFEEIALSYGLGMALIALEFIVFWSIKIRPTAVNILLPWLLIFIPLFLTKRIPLKVASLDREKKRYSLFEVFLLSGIVLEVILSFFRALIKPIESFDSIAIYAIRSKVFYEAGGIPADFFENITNAFPNSGHPLMIPLIETWVYTFIGSLNDFLVKAAFPLFFVALLIIFYFALREIFDRKKAFIFTFLLATIPQFNRFSSVGYADFTLAYFFTTAFLYLFYWMKNRKIRYLIISAFFMGLSCWTKMEGWALFLAIILVFLLFIAANLKRERRLFIKFVIFALIALVIAGPWLLLINTMQLENEAFKFKTFGHSRFLSSIFNFDRCPRIAYEFQKQFFGPKKWNIIWVIFLVLFVLNLKRCFSDQMKYITALLILVMVGYAYSYLLMPLKEGEPINIYISTNLSRLFIHFTPLAAFWIASLCKEREYINI